MIAKIICPSCQTLGQFSVDGGNFKGPYRCWKCRTLYTLDMVNSAVVSLQPLTDEEFKEIKAKQEAEKHGHTSGGGVAHTTLKRHRSMQSPLYGRRWKTGIPGA